MILAMNRILTIQEEAFLSGLAALMKQHNVFIGATDGSVEFYFHEDEENVIEFPNDELLNAYDMNDFISENS